MVYKLDCYKIFLIFYQKDGYKFFTRILKLYMNRFNFLFYHSYFNNNNVNFTHVSLKMCFNNFHLTLKKSLSF